MMPRLRDRLFRLATGRATHAADLDEELVLHLDLLTEEFVVAGMEPAGISSVRSEGLIVSPVCAGARRTRWGCESVQSEGRRRVEALEVAHGQCAPLLWSSASLF